MKLWTYIGKKVLIELTNGQKFIGEVTNYDDEIDNESGEDSIHLDDGIALYDFDESQIEYIEVLNKYNFVRNECGSILHPILTIY
ncbi:LSM domain protein [Staphylococcus aureus]